nr:hypothetical protein [Elizabethkingia sp. ASV34]
MLRLAASIKKGTVVASLIIRKIASYPRPVSYTHLTLPTTVALCRSRWWAGH